MSWAKGRRQAASVDQGLYVGPGQLPSLSTDDRVRVLLGLYMCFSGQTEASTSARGRGRERRLPLAGRRLPGGLSKPSGGYSSVACPARPSGRRLGSRGSRQCYHAAYKRSGVSGKREEEEKRGEERKRAEARVAEGGRRQRSEEGTPKPLNAVFNGRRGHSRRRRGRPT